MPVGTLAVVGLGLIGGSVARGAREPEAGRDRSSGAIARPRRLPRRSGSGFRRPDRGDARGGRPERRPGRPGRAGARDRAGWPNEVRRAAPADCVVTDTGSTKASLAAAMDALAAPGGPFRRRPPDRRPRGLRARRLPRRTSSTAPPASITPTPSSDPAALALVESLLDRARLPPPPPLPRPSTTAFSPLISHLPHVAAYALVRAVFDGVADPGLVRTFAGGGFRDFTRIAASDPDMWRDICLDNRDEILRAIDLLAAELADLRASIAGRRRPGPQRLLRPRRADCGARCDPSGACGSPAAGR